jgi:MFS family permease
MWCTIAFTAQAGLYVMASFKSVALDIPALNNDVYLTTVGALGTLTNGVCRAIWGMAYDRVGFRVCISICSTGALVIMILFQALTASRFTYTAAIVVNCACLAGLFATAPAEIYKLFGNATVYGILYSAFAFAGVIGVRVANKVADIAEGMFGEDDTPNTEEFAFRYLALMAGVALVLVQFHRPPKSRQTAAPSL